jgi:eukaryotic-like serine/threonine-protein kinase
MTPDRWRAIGELFDQALAAPTTQRTAVIDRGSGTDQEVRREVLSLLASHNAARGGFVQKRIDVAIEWFHRTSTVSVPARVGPYRLVRELGRGGMGAVFLAERDDDEYRAKVAVKLVRPGMDTEFILARFRRERQTLARLEHPNISRLLDGGTADHGLPYIVMEYIDGPWITTYAAQHKLGVEARLRLFLAVCSAVDYAHRNFIVHRDLKPGNILVDPAGVPKLLDFGICKLLVESVTAVSDTVAPPLTPSYASPEQIRGEAATTSSDIYSLGAVLYELLTGTNPRRFETLTPLAIERALENPIVRPSAAVDDKRLARQLSGDLDNILQRALDVEPSRRYESAAQLADDVRRHLEHEPVRARPHTVGYRARTFVRRHRGPTAAVAAVVVTLMVGIAVSLYEARLADVRVRQIRSLASTLVFEVHDAVRDLPGSTQARQTIVQAGLDYLNALNDSAEHDARTGMELARAYRRLGDVQGDVETANLGDLPGALALYQKARSLLDEAIGREPTDTDARTEQLIVYNRIARIQAETGKPREALQTYQDAIARASNRAPSSHPEFRLALADAYLGSSQAKRDLGDDRGAFESATNCLRLYRDAAHAGRSNPIVMKGLAGAHAAVGMSEMRLGQLERALDSFRQGAATLESLVAAAPRNVTLGRSLMLAYGHVGDVLGNPDRQNLGDRPGALRAYRQAADVGKRLYELDRSDQRAASDYGIVLSHVETAMDDNVVPEKLAVQRESLRVLDETARNSPDNVALQIHRALVRLHLGDTLTAAGKIEDARLAYLESAAITEPSLKLGQASLVVLFMRSNQRLALNAVARGRRDDALVFAERALRTGETPPADAPSAQAGPRGRSAMGLTYAALLRSPVRQPGDREDALSWLRKAADAWHTAQSGSALTAADRREIRDVEEALTRIARR